MSNVQSLELFRQAVKELYPSYSLEMEVESGDFAYMKTQKLYWLWQKARGEG